MGDRTHPQSQRLEGWRQKGKGIQPLLDNLQECTRRHVRETWMVARGLTLVPSFWVTFPSHPGLGCAGIQPQRGPQSRDWILTTHRCLFLSVCLKQEIYHPVVPETEGWNSVWVELCPWGPCCLQLLWVPRHPCLEVVSVISGLTWLWSLCFILTDRVLCCLC